jgi:hypothetical protein
VISVVDDQIRKSGGSLLISDFGRWRSDSEIVRQPLDFRF